MRVNHRTLHTARRIGIAFIIAIGVSCGLIPSSTPPRPEPNTQSFAPSVPASPPTPTARVVKASWYGEGFAGRETTSGEIYDPSALTAASKTLPLGSVIKVSNPKNGRSVRVRINDRGPFAPGRSLDLSHGAAEKLGIVHEGVARVKLETVPAVPPSADPNVTI